MTFGIDAVGALSVQSGRASAPQAADEADRKVKDAALQFEQIMIRQMLEPLERSLTASFGGESQSPMIGGMIMASISQSITDGGGLGLASVIEQALRQTSSASVSAGAGHRAQLDPKRSAEGET